MVRLTWITAIAVATALTAMDGAGQSGARTGAPIDVTVHEGTSMSVAVSPDGRTLAVDDLTHRRDLDRGRVLRGQSGGERREGFPHGEEVGELVLVELGNDQTTTWRGDEEALGLEAA